MAARSWWGAELLDQGPPDAVWARAHREITFGRLRTEVDTLTGLLRAYGIRGGNTVAMYGTPSFTQLWAIFALWSLGVQVLLFEPGMAARERRALLDTCAPQFLVTFGGAHAHRGVFLDECEVLVRARPGGRESRSSHCIVQFSSGTTGRSKIVGRTSESLLVELDRLRTLDGMPAAGERVAVLESVAHSFGLIGGVLYALDAGATAVFPMAHTAPEITAGAAAAHVVLGNPGHFARITALDEVSLPHLRLAVSGGEALPREVFDAFHRRHGVRIGQAYGTTETGIVATDLAGTSGPPTVGVPVRGIRTRITDGVLEVHVPHSPYLFDEEPWPGGWMSTHDLVSRDPATGALRLRGRVETAGRTHLDLLEIESALRAHRLVTEAVVLGTDPIEAHVASAADLDHGELRSWCRRFLGEAAVPARYHIVRELPRTANGKVLRHRIRLLEHTGAAAEKQRSQGSEDGRRATVLD